MAFAYDPAHRMTHKTDERGYTTTYVYDARGRISRVELPPRPVYDPATDRFGVEQEVHQHSPGDTVQGLVNGLPPGSPAAPNPPLFKSAELTDAVQMGSIQYQGRTDQWGAVTSAMDALQREVRAERDGAGDLTRVTTPTGRCTTYTHDHQGNVLSMARLGPVQCGLEAAQRAPGQAVTIQRTYEPRFNQVKTETDPLGRTITVTYDYEVDLPARGLPVQITYPSVADENGEMATPVQTFEYNAYGQVTRQVDTRGIATCLVYTQGVGEEAAGGANPLFAPGVTPVPGLLTQVKADCGGALEQMTTYGEFDAAGNPQLVVAFDGTAVTRQTRWAYDARNRITAETDALGAITRFRYDDGDNLMEIVGDAGGRSAVWTFTYDPVGLLLSERLSGDGLAIERRFGYDVNRQQVMEEDGRGNRTRYFYDEARQLVRIVDAAGQATTMTYDLDGRLAGETDPLGRVDRVGYDALGRPAEMVTDAGGLDLTTRMTYDLAGNVLTMTDAAGTVTCHEYDALDRRTTTIHDCDGQRLATRFTYDLADNLAAVTDALGRTARFTYDALNRQTSLVDPLGHTTHFTYDEASNLAGMTDPLDRTTRFDYDLLDRLTEITDALGNSSTYTYDSLGKLTTFTDSLGRVVRYTHDVFDRRTSVTDPLGAVSVFTYDASHNLVSETDPLGRVTQYHYDPLNRLIGTVDAQGHRTSLQYDAAGRLIAVTDELERTARHQYDGADRPVAVTDPLNRTTTFDYDAVGNRTSVTDPLGNVTRYLYDRLYRRTEVVDAQGHRTRMAYDAVGNLASLADPAGNTTTYTYDALDRLIDETNTLGAARTYSYDAVGNLVAYVDRNGRERRFTYDALDRLVQENWVDAGRTVDYAFDAAGQLTSVSDPDSTYSMTYDGRGRNTSVSNAGTPGVPAVALHYAYDAFSNVRAVSEVVDGQAGGASAYVYDARNRLTRITQSGDAVVPKRVDFAYNAAGMMTALDRYRDLAGTQLVAASTFAYDAADQLTAITHMPGATAAEGGALAENRLLTWRYDAAGRAVEQASPDGTSAFGYDARHQLVGAGHSFQPDEAYTYDGAGNRTGGGYTVGPNNRLTSDGVYTYAYDAEGNRIRRTENATGAVTEYRWDYRNRLTGVIFRDAANAVAREITHTYDALDRRIATAIDLDGHGPAAAAVERFVYDGMHIALVFDGAGSLTHRYLYGPAADLVLADEQHGGQIFWPLVDRLGSVVDVLDGEGALQGHRSYDAFGRITAQTNPALAHRFAFTGREWDEAGDLHYYRSRYYDANVGQFLSEDPIGFRAGDTNLYRYVFNQPTGYRDPSGYWSLEGVLQSVAGAIQQGAATLENRIWSGVYEVTSRIPEGVWDAHAKADQFASGVGSGLTGGATDWVREKAYGHEATKNHHGTLRTAGQITGVGLGLAIGGHALVVNGASLAPAAAALRSGYLTASTAIGAGNAIRKLVEQDPCDPFTWWDALALLPPALWGLGTVARSARGATQAGTSAGGLMSAGSNVSQAKGGLATPVDILNSAIKQLRTQGRKLLTLEQKAKAAGKDTKAIRDAINDIGSELRGYKQALGRLNKPGYTNPSAARQLEEAGMIGAAHGVWRLKDGFVTIPQGIKQVVFLTPRGVPLPFSRARSVLEAIRHGATPDVIKKVFNPYIYRAGEIVENLQFGALNAAEFASLGLGVKGMPQLTHLAAQGSLRSLFQQLKGMQDVPETIYIFACRTGKLAPGQLGTR